MTSFTSYPPIVHHASTSHPVPASTAHSILTTFLHLANLDPAYRPDSTLTERGPQSTSSAGNPNLTLHHLHRIKLGLEGTNLGVEDLETGFFGQNGNGRKESATSEKREREREGGGENKKRKWLDRDAGARPGRAGMPEVISTAEEDVAAVVTAQDKDHTPEATDGGEGWQDPEAFELAQGDEDVDMNNAERDPAGAELDELDEGILEGETGRLLNVDEELRKEDGAAQLIRTGDVVDKQQADGKRNGVSKVLSKEGKDRRKKLKKLRGKEERKNRDNGKAKQVHVEPSRGRGVDDKEEIEEKPRPRKTKKKSKVDG